METITVVIIIIILIVLGIVYASNQRRSSMEQERERSRDLDAMIITTNVLNMDFVRCSQLETTQDACADYYKIKALSEHAMKEENRLFFNRLLGDAEITVRIMKNISFSDQDNENITLFRPTGTENKSRIMINTPIIVNDPVRNINYFALMEVIAFR